MKLTGYFIIDSETQKFVGIDSYSGGYPYMTSNITAAHNFNKLDDAVGYKTSSREYINWKIVTIEIVTTEII